LFDYDLIFMNKIANKIIIIAKAKAIFFQEIGSSGVIVSSG